ncbi:alpha/beta hydrolase [Cytobacillus praedii]
MCNKMTIKYGEIQNLALEATFIKSETNRKEKTIIYIHGGGLVYGNRLDLPEVYINQLLDAGYDFLTLDYPLAPESKLSEIIQSVADGVNWFLEHAIPAFGIQTNEYILFGRSSGAFLCFLLNKGYLQQRPKAIVSLYGYHSLMNSSFKGPSQHYLKFPRLETSALTRLIGDTPLVNGSIEKRYALYVYYRQTGKWVYQLVNPNESLVNYSLTKDELLTLPPTFLTASTADQDVPYEITYSLSEMIPDNELFTVNGLEHDYDRNTHLPESQQLYVRMIKWLETV